MEEGFVCGRLVCRFSRFLNFPTNLLLRQDGTALDKKRMIGPGRVSVTVCDLNAGLAPGPQEQGLLI